MKGITSIITILLLLLITIAMIAMAFTFLGGITETAATASEKELEGMATRIGRTISVDSVGSGVIYIRAIGAGDIEQGSVSLFNSTGHDITSGSCPTATITSGQVGQCNFVVANCPSGTGSKAAAPANTDTFTCP